MHMKNLKPLRIAAGLKTSELAERAKLSYHTIHYHENGLLNNPSEATVKALAVALNCKVESLFFGEITSTPIIQEISQ